MLNIRRIPYIALLAIAFTLLLQKLTCEYYDEVRYSADGFIRNIETAPPSIQDTEAFYGKFLFAFSALGLLTGVYVAYKQKDTRRVPLILTCLIHGLFFSVITLMFLISTFLVNPWRP